MKITESMLQKYGYTEDEDEQVVATVIMKGAHGNMLQKKRIRFKPISGFKECYIQDAKEKDQERMDNIPTLVDKLQAGYQTKYIINDFEEKGISYTFSEASRRIKELGDIILYGLGEIFKTVQCPRCLRYSKEGTYYSTCGVCLVPSPEQTRDIKN